MKKSKELILVFVISACVFGNTFSQSETDKPRKVLYTLKTNILGPLWANGGLELEAKPFKRVSFFANIGYKGLYSDLFSPIIGSNCMKSIGVGLGIGSKFFLYYRSKSPTFVDGISLKPMFSFYLFDERKWVCMSPIIVDLYNGRAFEGAIMISGQKTFFKRLVIEPQIGAGMKFYRAVEKKDKVLSHLLIEKWKRLTIPFALNIGISF